MHRTILSQRISELRKKQGMTQSEFGIQLAEYIGRKNPFTISAVSSWEQGVKVPAFPTIVAMADFFHVSTEYLRGYPEVPRHIDAVNVNLLGRKYEIQPEILNAYDEQPVWIEFSDVGNRNRWGIVSIERKSIVFPSGSMPIDMPGYKVFAIPLPNEFFRETFFIKPLPWDRLFQLGTERLFWVEISTKDAFIKEQYTGWYRHNEQMTCIINDIGLTLPYSGYGKSWRAYAEPFRRDLM